MDNIISNFSRGEIPSIGTRVKSRKCGVFTVVNHKRVLEGEINRTKLLVNFEVTGYQKWCSVKDVKSGNIRDPLKPTVGGVGYVGEGTYGSRGDDKLCYQTWLDMIKRCYAPKTERIAKEYRGVLVCLSWHNYQNFAQWFYSNHKEGYRLDKDLKVLGSRSYSPETCTFVPVDINSFLTGGLKRGIYFNNRKGKWVAQCQDGGKTKNGNKKQTYLGAYNSETSALNAYKDFKLSKIDLLEKEYSKSVPQIIFDNLRTFVKELK